MPLLQTQDTYTLRIQAGQVEIRRVYLDSTLLWGLYDITYHLAGGTQGSNPIGEYVWGVADENLPKPSGPNQTYYTKFQGWYEGTNYVTAIPAVTKDFHRDLDLYAKWTQRKYTYSGTYMWQWTEVIHHEGDGGDTEEESASGVAFSAITTTNPTYWKIGQCTRWCLRRTESAFGSPALNSNRDAKNWILSNSDFGDGWSPIPGGYPQPGDVVVFGPSSDNPYGHVLFQETDSIITQSNVRYPGGSWADWWLSHGYKEWDSEDQVWRPERELYSCVNIGKPGSYLGGSRLGVVRYYGSGGGGGGGGGGGWDEVVTHTEYGNVAETDCPSQKPPTLPNPPKGSWTQTQQNTYTRDYNYNGNTWGSWNLASSSWDTSGSDWI